MPTELLSAEIITVTSDTVIEVVEVARQGPTGPPGDTRLPDPATVPDYYTFAAIGGEYVTVPFPAGSGDMQSLIYDPRGIAADAFNFSNLTGNIDGGVFT